MDTHEWGNMDTHGRDGERRNVDTQNFGWKGEDGRVEGGHPIFVKSR
jgi:hypothetical protein